MKTIPKFCRECGLALKAGSVDADKIKILDWDSAGGSTFTLDSAFNEKTGERNEAETYTCPKWRKHWFLGSNSHDKIVFYENDLHWL